MKLKVHGSRLLLRVLRQCFFTQRVVNLLNKLPASVVETSSVNLFKKRLDDWILDVGIESYASHPVYTSQFTSYNLAKCGLGPTAPVSILILVFTFWTFLH